jgi:hypothetical protein
MASEMAETIRMLCQQVFRQYVSMFYGLRKKYKSTVLAHGPSHASPALGKFLPTQTLPFDR